MLELKNICWRAPDGKEVLKDVNLQLSSHRFIAISGPNGSGKTTLGKIIMGIEKPTSGKIYFNGNDITDLDVSQRAKLGIGFGFQTPVSFKGISIRKFLNLAAQKEMDDVALCVLLRKVGLCAKSYLDRDMDSTLSGGEMKRIEIASVLARNVEFMIFDEPEAGIDLWSFNNLISVFDAMRKEKQKTIVIVSHQERLLQTADEIVLVANGTIADHGSSADMLQKMHIQNRDCSYGGRL